MTRRRVLAAAALLLLIGAANVHLVYVAFSTQPECVPHLKTPDDMAGGYRAARSAC